MERVRLTVFVVGRTTSYSPDVWNGPNTRLSLNSELRKTRLLQLSWSSPFAVHTRMIVLVVDTRQGSILANWFMSSRWLVSPVSIRVCRLLEHVLHGSIRKSGPTIYRIKPFKSRLNLLGAKLGDGFL